MSVKSGIVNRDFSWAAYGIQKAISLTVTVVCAGLGAIKDAAKTVVAGAKQAATGLKAFGTTVVKSGWKLAAKVIGKEIAKGVAKQVVTELVNYGINKALMPNINEAVLEIIEGPIIAALESNETLKRLLEIDAKNRNLYFQNLIRNRALQLLAPSGNQSSAINQIATGIFKGEFFAIYLCNYVFVD